jgi:peptide/nickel transport system substrate-binding protein
MARFHLRIFALLMVLALAITACGPTAAPTEAMPEVPGAGEPAGEQPTAEAPAAESGGTIVIALAAAPVTLDPADHRNRESETVIRNMFDGLVTRDNTSGVHLQLAESMNWVDEQTLEITLRQGVMFHNGTEMTADDVVFTFERIINENAIEYPEAHTSPRKGLIAPLESIEKTGDYAVTMHFSGPWPPAMQLLVHQQIVPKAYIEEVGTQGFIENPVGTGPFRFVSAQPGYEEVVMERFDDYYGGSPELPPVGVACVEAVVFTVNPEASTRVSALLAGEVDIIAAVPQDLVPTLEANPNVQVATAAGTQPKWVELNVNQPPFDDVLVRQALNYAVDKELIIEQIYRRPRRGAARRAFALQQLCQRESHTLPV